MSVPLEHDYIGLSDASSLERSSDSSNISSDNVSNNVFNLKSTELSLGLPGFGKNYEETATKFGRVIKNYNSGAKRGFSDVNFEKNQTQQLISSSDVKSVKVEKKDHVSETGSVLPSAKTQVVGWPPIRSFRKNTMATNLSKNDDVAEENLGSVDFLYVKVSMDGAPYLRKIDLKIYHNYAELSKALEKMFSCFTLGQCSSNGIKGQEGVTENNLKDVLHGSECVLTYEDKDGDWMLVGDVPWGMFIDSCKKLRIVKGSEAIRLAPRSTVKCKNKN